MGRRKQRCKQHWTMLVEWGVLIVLRYSKVGVVIVQLLCRIMLLLLSIVTIRSILDQQAVTLEELLP
ncbi:hypothetical protein Ahy_B09g096243 isoform B [Arachis hypogaea]|uniref:Uncharacterized protein n=1 Tax=Arachis hypogaea TaxID=3818 RepID=A0A444XJC1_ARAHY|nr:hypothetical protein Ahy_B09g096243 isoform B [Arachis hypogaea]